MQLEFVLVISSFLCALVILDEDLPIIASSALLPALFLSSGAQYCEDVRMLDVEKERNAICSTYHLDSNKFSAAVNTGTVNHAAVNEEEKTTLLDNVIRFQFNLVLRSTESFVLIYRHGRSRLPPLPTLLPLL